jgi:hypothetical protein
MHGQLGRPDPFDRGQRGEGESEDALNERRALRAELGKVIQFAMDAIRQLDPTRREALYQIWERSAQQHEMPDLRDLVQALRGR